MIVQYFRRPTSFWVLALPVLALCLGGGLSVWSSEFFRGQAISDWQNGATQDAQWLNSALLGWFEESYGPLSALAAVYESSDDVSETEFLTAFQAVEERMSADFLESVGVLQSPPTENETFTWRLVATANPLGPLSNPSNIAHLQSLRVALATALADRGRVVLGPPFTSAEGVAFSPAVLVVGSPSGQIAVVGFLNYQELAKSIYAIHAPDGVLLTIYGRFVYPDSGASQITILDDDDGDGAYSVSTRAATANTELAVIWHFKDSYGGGPDQSLRDVSLWAGLVISVLTAFVVATVASRHRRIADQVTRTAEALRESEDEVAWQRKILEGVLNSMAQGIAAFDRDLKLVAWNANYPKVREYPEDLIFEGQSFETLMKFDVARQEFGPGDPEVQAAERVKLAQLSESHAFERRRPNGHYIEVRGGPLSGGGFVSTYTDVTDRKLAEQEVAEAEALLRSAVDNMTNAVMLLDSNLKVRLFNRRLVEFYGFPDGFMEVGLPVEAIVRLRAERGDYGDGDIDELVLARLAGYRDGEVSNLEDRTVGGRYLHITRAQVPGGGTIVVGTDVTSQREAEQQTQALLESAPDAMLAVDKTGKIVLANRQFEPVFGYKPEDLLDRNVEVLVPDRARHKHQALVDGFISNPEIRGMGTGMSLTGRRADGSEFPIEVSLSPVSAGNRKLVIAAIRDVTERLKVQNRLRESEILLRATIDNISGGILVSDGDMRIRLFNDTFSALLGYPEGLVAEGKLVTDLWRFQVRRGDFGNVDEDEQIRSMQTIFDARATKEYERDISTGATLDMRFSPMIDGGGVWIASDVTKRKEMMQALKESEQQLRRILEESPIAVAVSVDDGSERDGIIEFTNPRFRTMLGIVSENEGVERTSDYFLPDNRANFHEDQLDEGQSVFDEETLWHSKDGKEIWTLMSVNPISFNDRQSALIWLYDITERKAIERELVHAKEQAESATKAKDSFLATMSHEIRTPMNGVVGMIDLMTQTSLDQDQRQMASTIRDSAFALLTIINDILDFSKIEAGKMELEQVPISITTTLDGVGETMGPNANKKGISFVSYCDPEIPPQVYGDQVRLRQVLFNLLGNAIKFTEQGTVTMRADLANLTGTRATVCYSVRDQGIGMTEAQIANLFQPFQQAESSTTRRFGGTGLGLTIVRRLVDLMGGVVLVESDPGEGSVFTVTITHDVVKGGSLEIIRDLDGVRVLSLVPDDEVRSLIVKSYLEPHGATVDVIHDSQLLMEAARAAAADGRPYDVVTLGFDYSDDEKIVLREQFRNDEELKKMRFVVGRPTAGIGTSIELPDTTIVPATPLTQRNLVNAVAVALGKASPNIRYGLEAEKMANRPAPSVEDAIANDELILVVEDNKTNQDVIQRQLRLLGYQCEIAEDGREGLAAIRSGRYAIALSDVHMPNMDGFEMTGHVRAGESDRGKRFPIIAITANALQGESERCLDAGMDDYLSKPLEMKKLRALLKKWLPHVEQEAIAPGQQEADKPTSTDAAATHMERPTGPAASSAPSEEPPLDVTALQDIFGDDPETIGEVLADFIEPAWNIVAEVEAAVENHSAADIGAAGHKLKSSSRAVGANRLSDLCLILEKAGKADDWDTIDAEFPKLRPLMSDVEDFIRSL